MTTSSHYAGADFAPLTESISCRPAVPREIHIARRSHWHRMLTATLAVVLGTAAVAQTTDIPMADPISVPAGPKPARSGAYAELSTVIPTDADYRHQKRHQSGASSWALGWNGRLAAGDRWSIPLDVMAQKIRFGTVPDTPVPDDITTSSLSTGLTYRTSENLTLMARIGATAYRASDVGSNDLGLSSGLMGTWRYSPALTYVFGMMFNPDSDRRSFPMIGINWAINEQLNLSLILPRPRLTFRPNENWSFHVGGKMNGATFRTSETLGSRLGNARYSGALGSYRDFRVGAGIGYTFTPALSLEAETGLSVNREIRYERLGEAVRFGPAPYLSLGVKFGF